MKTPTTNPDTIFFLLSYKDKVIFWIYQIFFILLVESHRHPLFMVWALTTFDERIFFSPWCRPLQHLQRMKVSQLVTLQSPVLGNDWEHTGVQTFKELLIASVSPLAFLSQLDYCVTKISRFFSSTKSFLFFLLYSPFYKQRLS